MEKYNASNYKFLVTIPSIELYLGCTGVVLMQQPMEVQGYQNSNPSVAYYQPVVYGNDTNDAEHPTQPLIQDQKVY